MRVYNKLVRDNIVKIIEDKGEKTNFRILENSEYREKLNKKLQEEVQEYLEDNNVEELADIVEVVYGILNSMGVSIEEFEKVRMAKFEKKGGFQNKIFLESVEEK